CAPGDPPREALVAEIGARHTADPAAARGVAAVMRTRQPVLVVRATEAALREAAQDVEQLVPLRQLAPRSWIVVPLVAHERVLGALTLAVTESARRYGPVDLAFAPLVASPPAAAIQGARLSRGAPARRPPPPAATTPPTP